MRPIITFDARCFHSFRIRMKKSLRTSIWKVAFDPSIRTKAGFFMHPFWQLHTERSISSVEMLLLWIEYQRKTQLFEFPLSTTFLSIKSWWCQLHGFATSLRYSRIPTRLNFASWNIASNRLSSPIFGANIDRRKPLYLKGRHSKPSWLKCAARPMVTLLNLAIKKVGIAGWVPFGIGG